MRTLCLMAALAVIVLNGCALESNHDYSAQLQSNVKSIVILTPASDSTSVDAAPAVLASAALPLSEAGYYVFPVTMVHEAFRQNGVGDGAEAQAVSPRKLSEVFNADAALYLKVEKYGAQYQIVNSTVTVRVSARLVDLRSGQTIWSKSATTTDADSSSGSGNIWGQLIGAAVKQMVNTFTDEAFTVAQRNARELYNPASYDEPILLYGPRSKHYRQDWVLGGGK